jgi:cell shape-determining protein MreC
MPVNTSIGEDPITIFTLLSELQREAEVWKRDCKKWEERVSSREALVRQEQTKNEGLTQQIEELQIQCGQQAQQIETLQISHDEHRSLI